MSDDPVHLSCMAVPCERKYPHDCGHPAVCIRCHPAVCGGAALERCMSRILGSGCIPLSATAPAVCHKDVRKIYPEVQVLLYTETEPDLFSDCAAPADLSDCKYRVIFCNRVIQLRYCGCELYSAFGGHYVLERDMCQAGDIRQPRKGSDKCRGVSFFLIGNQRLREVLCYIGNALAGSGRTDLQTDWIDYRKAAFEAFWSGDLTALKYDYGEEKYLYSVYGHGLTSLRFRYEMLLVVAMAALLALFVIFLWNWNCGNSFLDRCARYFAVSYILKMSVTLVLQMNMIVSPYMEFLFTGMDIAEIILPILLAYESFRMEKHLFSGQLDSDSVSVSDDS